MIAIQLAEARLTAGSIVRALVTFDREEDGSKDVEVSVVWETSGKGDTDLGLLHFEKIRNVTGEHRVQAQLPLLPLTYDGTIVKIGWFVRARKGGDVIDAPFEVVSIA